MGINKPKTTLKWCRHPFPLHHQPSPRNPHGTRPDRERFLSELSEQKAILRGHMLELRAEAAARDPDAGEKLAARFPIKLFERYGPVVAGYIAIGDEIDPAPLLARLQSKGATIVLPRIETGGRMTFREADPKWHEAAAFGLTQPSADAPELRPSLVLAPLLAFDARGTRLGYGKGYYDRTLAALGKKPLLVGYAFSAQELDFIPRLAHDLPLDILVTETGLRSFKTA